MKPAYFSFELDFLDISTGLQCRLLSGTLTSFEVAGFDQGVAYYSQQRENYEIVQVDYEIQDEVEDQILSKLAAPPHF